MIDFSSTWLSQDLSLLTDRLCFLALPPSADFHADRKLDKNQGSPYQAVTGKIYLL